MRTNGWSFSHERHSRLHVEVLSAQALQQLVATLDQEIPIALPYSHQRARQYSIRPQEAIAAPLC